MCIVCVEYQLGNLTRREAYLALTEIVNSELVSAAHTREVIKLIEETEKTKLSTEKDR